MDAGKGGAGEGAFRQKRPPRTPTRKNFGWWGGRTAGVPLRAGPEASGRKSAACRMGRACWGGRPLRPKAVSGRARPLSFYLVDAAEVAAAFKSGVQEQFRDVEGHALAGHALAEAEHVGVVVLAGGAVKDFKKSIKDDEAEAAQLKEPRTIEHQANSSDITTDSKSHIKS